MMKITYLCFLGAALMALEVMGHGSMVYPKPRSSHGQTLDERNRCGAKDPYSKAGLGGGGEYCGIGCMGDACLYYQIGCYAGCGTCSLWGKDLYPTEADFKLADDCHPMEPTLGGGDPAHERELRTHNIDNLSQRGDWTRPNPWRAPGYAGKGNPSFPPCGVNSGGNKTFVNPPTTATDVPKGGPGTDLPSLGVQAKWTPGSIVNVSWALYANHGKGIFYFFLFHCVCVLRRGRGKGEGGRGGGIEGKKNCLFNGVCLLLYDTKEPKKKKKFWFCYQNSK